MSLDPRRAQLWQAMGLGPEWVQRDGTAPGPTADNVLIARQDTQLEPRAAAIATMDWAELEAATVDCTACDLCKSRKQVVFGVGHRQSPWLLVGEAPGAEEDARGEPFVGQAGKLLDNLLASIGRSRCGDAANAVFIANVLKCRPPVNRNPQPEEVAACEPFLMRQIALVAPKLILVMGRFAAQSVLHTDASIAALRGRVHQVRVGDRRIPAIVTYHPAYLLRNLADKSKSWADLCLALDVDSNVPVD